MGRYVKLLVLAVLKFTGVFALTRWLTAGRLRILCYHGISIGDQHRFQPYLFMRMEVFRKRMQSLVNGRWRIIALDEGVHQLRAGALSGAPVVLTIDDGWMSTWTEQVPVLQKLGIPATIYVTTYYCERRADVFNVAMYYMLWKTGKTSVELGLGNPEIDGVYDLSGDRIGIGTKWLEVVSREYDWVERQEILVTIARVLGFDPDEVLSGDRFRNMTPEQITQLADSGFGVELHTHRHRFPRDPELLANEINENRTRIESWTGKRSSHLCYPSGIFYLEHLPLLHELGIESATTCRQGSNVPGDNPLLLSRVLDRDDWTQLEFEAALSGVSDVLRTVVSWLPLFRRSPGPAA